MVVQIKDLNKTDKVKQQLLERFFTCGFVIFEFVDKEVEQETLENFVNFLGLGRPFIPRVYNNYKLSNSKGGFNVLRNRDDHSHKAFNTSLEQEIHSDGTLRENWICKNHLIIL